jgi:PAS domain S-box-containing protein
VIPSALSLRPHGSTQTNFVMALTIGLMVLVFGIDLQISLGVASAVPYVAVILLTLWIPVSCAPVVFACLCSGLTLLGYWWSPPGGEAWEVAANRFLALFAIWTVTLIVVQYRKYFLHSTRQGEHVTGPGGEEQLADPQKFTASIIENLPNMVFVKDAKDLRFVRVNQAGESLLGCAREDLIGKNDYDFFPQEEADFFTAHDRAVLQNGTLLDIPEEAIHTRKKGIRILHTKKIPLHDEHGRPEYLLGISEDITSRKLAEQELGKSQQRYEDLVNFIEGIVWECEFPSYQFTFVSQQAERLLGYPIEQWLKEPGFFISHIHPEDRAEALAYCLQETKAKRAHEIEYRMIASDGQVIWLRDLVTVAVENNQPVKVRGIMVDITERKRAEDALEESRKRFYAIFESAGIGIVLVNANGSPVESNLSLQTFLGYTADELQGMTFVDFTHEEDIPMNLGFFQELKTGIRSSYTMQKRYIRKDGQEVWGNLTVTPIRRIDGKFEYAIAMIEDINDKKKSEAALQTSESTIKSFFESSPLMMGIVELVGDDIRHLSDNPAAGEFFGVDPKSLTNQFASDLGVPGDRIELWVKQYRKSEQTRQPAKFEYRHAMPDAIRWLSATVTCIVSGESTYSRFAYVVEDITERRRLEDEIFQHNEELEAEVERRTIRIQELEQRRMQVEKLAALAQVAAGVAHEINNPLASIGQSLEVLKRAIAVSHPRYKYIGKIQDSVDRMAHIVRQLYQLYRPDTVSLEPVGIHGILRLAIGIMKDSAKRQGVSIVEHIPENLPSAKVSRNSITQILCNIIQNALDVSPRRGVVQIGTEEHSDVLVVLVTDQGPGISAEVAPHIFEPFFTTKEGTSLDGGMGMGLAVSYRLMESCGGSIDFLTELGKGTTFRVTIPLNKSSS